MKNDYRKGTHRGSQRKTKRLNAYDYGGGTKPTGIRRAEFESPLSVPRRTHAELCL